jgi:hypothetical protein
MAWLAYARSDCLGGALGGFIYMQPVRVYKYFLPSTSSRSAGPYGLRVSFERASSLAGTR